MAELFSFHTSAQPHHLEKLLLEENWTQLADALRNGGAHVAVHNTPLWAAVMYSYSLSHPQGTRARTLPVDLMVLDLSMDVCFRMPQGPKVTAVAWAAFCGQWNLCAQLIEQKFEIDTPSFSFWTALMDGIGKRCSGKVETFHLPGQDPLKIRTLTQRMDPSDRQDLNALVDMVWHKQPLRTQEALHWLSLAVLFRQFDVLEILLSKNIALQTEQTTGAAHPAVLAVETENFEALELLLSKGAQWISVDHTHSLLECATVASSLASVAWIVNHAPAHTLARMLPNAMVYATAMGWVEGMDCLHEAGAAVHQTASNGYNLLHQAALSGQLRSVQWLLDQGLELETPATNGVRPLDLLWQHHPNIAQKFSQTPSNVRHLRVV